MLVYVIYVGGNGNRHVKLNATQLEQAETCILEAMSEGVLAKTCRRSNQRSINNIAVQDTMYSLLDKLF